MYSPLPICTVSWVYQLFCIIMAFAFPKHIHIHITISLHLVNSLSVPAYAHSTRHCCLYRQTTNHLSRGYVPNRWYDIPISPFLYFVSKVAFQSTYCLYIYSILINIAFIHICTRCASFYNVSAHHILLHSYSIFPEPHIIPLTYIFCYILLLFAREY